MWSCVRQRRIKVHTICGTKMEQGFAPVTCDHHVKLIRYALNLAVEWEMIEKAPAQNRSPLAQTGYL